MNLYVTENEFPILCTMAEDKIKAFRWPQKCLFKKNATVHACKNISLIELSYVIIFTFCRIINRFVKK